MSIDHTLSWEVARVGGLLAYVLAFGSVALGMLLSLKAYSPAWPRFITNELHRFVTVLSLVFIGLHTVAVFLDPFTAFSPAEVLVPFASHYRPLWMALGIVSGYLAIAVWASEYVRKRIGYAWWRRFHYLAFAVFLLGALHGLGNGSDSRAWWALAMYAGTAGVVALLLGLRLARAVGRDARRVATAALVGAVVALALFAYVGPAQAGWNAIANGGNGSGASASWLADHPTLTIEGPTASFTARVDATILDDERVSGTFTSTDRSGSLQLLVRREAATLELTFEDGWSCSGPLRTAASERLQASCSGDDGATIEVTLEDLRRSGSGVVGLLEVSPG